MKRTIHLCKQIYPVLLLVCLFFLGKQNVYAAPETMPDGTIFDAEYYAASNPDVVAVVGNDPAALYQHYLLCGKIEGRAPYAAAVPAVAGGSNAAIQVRFPY